MSIVYPMDDPKAKPLNLEELPRPDGAQPDPTEALEAELARAEENKKQEQIAKWRAQGRDENGILLGSSLIEAERVKQAKQAAFDKLQKTNPTDFALIRALWAGESMDVVHINQIMFDDYQRYSELKQLAIKTGVLPEDYRLSDPVVRRKPGTEIPLEQVMEKFPELNVSAADKKAINALFGYIDRITGRRVPPVAGFAAQLMNENYSEYARLRQLKLGPKPLEPSKRTVKYLKRSEDFSTADRIRRRAEQFGAGAKK